jgi:hypothetical protein
MKHKPHKKQSYPGSPDICFDLLSSVIAQYKVLARTIEWNGYIPIGKKTILLSVSEPFKNEGGMQ